MRFDTTGAQSPLQEASPIQGKPAQRSPDQSNITSLLSDWSDGDPRALDRLVPLVDRDLRQLAQSYLATESPGHAMPATVVINELYSRLLLQKRVERQNRAQLLAIAAPFMRRILVNHARKEPVGNAVVLELGEPFGPPGIDGPELVALGHVQQSLARVAPRQSRIVELRFFGGLSIEETASVLGISPATVRLDWNTANAWLIRKLGRG